MQSSPLPITSAEYAGWHEPLEVRPSSRPHPPAVRRTVLLAALDGVELGAFDQSMIDWFVQLDEDVTRTLVSLLVRVRHAAVQGRPVCDNAVQHGPERTTTPEIHPRLPASPESCRERQAHASVPCRIVRDGRALNTSQSNALTCTCSDDKELLGA
ncbi:hypothetical protein [Actinomadura rayongensis]|uniref:Uncharacterized protein n=1 Tax=Actinomadura rayongensis TaxID=1429076 RepID=A0A6I4W4N4_9ACTN|nr:hypothetical protein [Actinomadura rayongensis]MXQ65649.1 hypothetical protein [Actinomadura rayongensis]